MGKPSTEIGPSDRDIDKRMMVFGVVICLALAAMFFLLGLLYIGPKLRSARSPHPMVQAPGQTPSAPRPAPEVQEQPEEAEAPSLDVEITEKGEEGTSDESQTGESAQDGVAQDDSGLTITLEPEVRENASSERASPPTARPEEQPKPRPAYPSEREMERPRAVVETRRSAAADVYRIQAGTFANRTNAEDLEAHLRRRGYKPEVEAVQVRDRILYRVQIGEYRNREDARELAKDLAAQGYSPIITHEKAAD